MILGVTVASFIFTRLNFLFSSLRNGMMYLVIIWCGYQSRLESLYAMQHGLLGRVDSESDCILSLSSGDILICIFCACVL